MSPYFTYLLGFLLAFAFSAALVPAVRAGAIRRGHVTQPREDRWHSSPTPALGGIAIFIAFLLAFAIAAVYVPPSGGVMQYLPLVLCAFLVFTVGLVDDLCQLSPQNKLVGQFIAAAILVFFGFKVEWFVSKTLNSFVSIFWIVAVTNAFNLLDNMDGLAAGIATISAFFLGAIILVGNGIHGGNGQLLILATFMGSLLGFLLYNFYPASIFMGDSGSQFLGFLLAGTTVHQQLYYSGQLIPIILVPLLIVFIPIWDTGFVSIMRTLFGRSIAKGGKDHTSHRLVAIGMSEGKAVVMLYIFSVFGGSVALLGPLYGPKVFLSCLFGFLFVSLLFWVFLAKVRVYPEAERSLVDRNGLLTTLWIDFTYKRRLFEVTLDVGLVSFGYWLSYVLRFEGKSYAANFSVFLESLPIIVACSIFCYFVFGVYQGVWRYTGISDLVTYLKAVTGAVLVSVLVVVVAYRFESFSRTVFFIFWGISFLFLAGSRLSFKMIAEVVRINSVSKGKRVLIYGAGDKGEVALREICNNPNLEMMPVGFIDDDVRKHKRKIQGCKVLGGRDQLADFVFKHKIEELIIASGSISPEDLKTVCAVCSDLRISVVSMELSLKRLNVHDASFKKIEEQKPGSRVTFH